MLIRALGMDQNDVTGKTRYLLGLACFHQERWADAEVHLTASLRNAPTPLAGELLERVRTNRKTRIERATDASRDFNPDELRKPAALYLVLPSFASRCPWGEGRPLHAHAARGVEPCRRRCCRARIVGAYRLRDRNKIFAFESWINAPPSSACSSSAAGATIQRASCSPRITTCSLAISLLASASRLDRALPHRHRRLDTDDPMRARPGTQIERSAARPGFAQSRVDDELPSPREVSRFILAPQAGRRARKSISSIFLRLPGSRRRRTTGSATRRLSTHLYGPLEQYVLCASATASMRCRSRSLRTIRCRQRVRSLI